MAAVDGCVGILRDHGWEASVDVLSAACRSIIQDLPGGPHGEIVDPTAGLTGKALVLAEEEEIADYVFR
jgi:hypothetical protein